MAATASKRSTAKPAAAAPAAARTRQRNAAGAQTVAARLPAKSLQQVEAAQRKFERGIIARGEAVEAGKPLPAGATHEIVGRRPDGSPLLKRKRFSTR
ncbi:MAG: hypothetical protein ACREX7_01420 [Casimicrobiaceae bacterium]